LQYPLPYLWFIFLLLFFLGRGCLLLLSWCSSGSSCSRGGGGGAGLGGATGVTGAAFLLAPSLTLGDVDFFPAQKAAVHRRVTTATNNGEKRIDFTVHIVDPAARLASVR
ncbi:hypothetical protein PENTCL1PPCAC_23272, partial [Pristionchus entomophagus]